MNLNVFRGGDAQTDLVSADFQHCNYHVMADHDALVHVPRQYQQSSLLPWAMVESLVARPRTWTIGAPVRSGTSNAVGATRAGRPSSVEVLRCRSGYLAAQGADFGGSEQTRSRGHQFAEREIPGHLRNGGARRSAGPSLRINIHPWRWKARADTVTLARQIGPVRWKVRWAMRWDCETGKPQLGSRVCKNRAVLAGP